MVYPLVIPSDLSHLKFCLLPKLEGSYKCFRTMLWGIPFANIYLGWVMWSFSSRIHLSILHLEIHSLLWKLWARWLKKPLLHGTFQPHVLNFHLFFVSSPWRGSFWMKLVHILPQISNWRKKWKELDILKFY